MTIGSIEYDPIAGRMLVTCEGRTDTYLCVPLDVFIHFKFASDPYSYLLSRIIGRYTICHGS